ncbi:MAG: endo-1,4-beta-xylanase, partial [Bacteroidota bacterium]
ISNAHLDDLANFRNGLADVHLREEYNTVVLENYMKMAFVLPSNEPMDIHNLTVEQLRATMNETNIETFLSNPDWTDMRKRGHAMIWFNQAPTWLNLVGPTWTGQQVFDFTRKYILALGEICGNRVDEWDVINEAISDQSVNGQGQWRQNTWYRRANDGSMTDWGEATYENYIKMLFVWAREAQPEARLHLNDYAIENFNDALSSKNRFMRDQVKALKACGAPIDGVGFQSHFVLSDMVSVTGEINQGFIDGVEASMEDLAAEGLEVALTELDIRICNEDRDEAFQEVAYQEICEMAYSQANCREILLWGLRDEDNWITLRDDPPFTGCQDASITEGDDYSLKPGYDGLAAAITALPLQDTFGFAPLNPGNGAPANCGGMGQLIPAILSVNGPNAVLPGDQVTVAVNYLASGDQDIIVWFQLDSDPFTVFSQVVRDVSEGAGIIEVTVDIPMSAPVGNFDYRYFAFITPDGGGINESFSELFQNRVTVLGDDSQLIISSLGPESVSPGDSVEVAISYSAVEGQQIVVWFQLDTNPFTVFHEFRGAAAAGQNEIIAKLFIPLNVPVAQDAYQYQTVLVPNGGGWPERISNIAQPDIDVVMVSSVAERGSNDLEFSAYPNPITDESVTVALPVSSQPTVIAIYSALG